MEHILEKHDKCEIPHCCVCDGGLAICTVCGGAEGTLTEDCCGRILSGDEQDDVYYGRLFYRASTGFTAARQ
jgi:hypothetical protein